MTSNPHDLVKTQFYTGPSRTADVGQTLQIGAHGPRSLHVIVFPR